MSLKLFSTKRYFQICSNLLFCRHCSKRTPLPFNQRLPEMRHARRYYILSVTFWLTAQHFPPIMQRFHSVSSPWGYSKIYPPIPRRDLQRRLWKGHQCVPHEVDLHPFAFRVGKSVKTLSRCSRPPMVLWKSLGWQLSISGRSWTAHMLHQLQIVPCCCQHVFSIRAVLFWNKLPGDI